MVTEPTTNPDPLLAEEPRQDYMTPTLAKWRRWTDLPFLILAIGSLPIVALEFIREDLVDYDRTFIDVVNVLLLVVFLADYLVELRLCSNRGSYVRHEWASGLIVITQALAVIPGLGAFGVLRVARAGRLVRVIIVAVRIIAIGGLSARDGRTVIRQHAAKFALGLAGFTWITSAVLFTMVEDVGRNGRVESFFDALWWSLGRVTTAGSEIDPTTTAGKIVAGFTTVIGVTAFAIVTAKIAEFLVRSDLEAEREVGQESQ